MPETAVVNAPVKFVEFPKIARLTRECVITEKIDGTNASITLVQLDREWPPVNPMIAASRDLGLGMFAGSRTQFITRLNDNHGFARWATDHAGELFQLGEGTHFGEWWGSGIQRGYGLQKGEKRFSLFNVARWADDRDREKFPMDRPDCCSVVPVLARGSFDTQLADLALDQLSSGGSRAVPGFMKPEGIVVFHEAARLMFKKTLEKDAEWKGKSGI